MRTAKRIATCYALAVLSAQCLAAEGDSATDKIFAKAESPLCGFDRWADVRTHPCSATGNFVGKPGCAFGKDDTEAIYQRPMWKECRHFANGLDPQWPGAKPLTEEERLVVDVLNLLLSKTAPIVLVAVPSESSIPSPERRKDVYAIYASSSTEFVVAPKAWSPNLSSSPPPFPPFVPDIFVAGCEHFHRGLDAMVLQSWSRQWLALDRIFGHEWRTCTQRENEALVNSPSYTVLGFGLMQTIQEALVTPTLSNASHIERLRALRAELEAVPDRTLTIEAMSKLIKRATGAMKDES